MSSLRGVIVPVRTFREWDSARIVLTKKLRSNSGKKLHKNREITAIWAVRAWRQNVDKSSQLFPSMRPHTNAQRLPWLSHLLRSAWSSLEQDCWTSRIVSLIGSPGRRRLETFSLIWGCLLRWGWVFLKSVRPHEELWEGIRDSHSHNSDRVMGMGWDTGIFVWTKICALSHCFFWETLSRRRGSLRHKWKTGQRIQTVCVNILNKRSELLYSKDHCHMANWTVPKEGLVEDLKKCVQTYSVNVQSFLSHKR